MTSSNNNPELIQVDWGTLRHGKVDILVHWNVEEQSTEGEFGPQTYYTYDEQRMNWVLPTPMASRAAIAEYFNNNYDQGENILNWAKAAKLQFEDVE